MSTPYSIVYQNFIDTKVTDATFLTYEQTSLDSLMESYLVTACSKFVDLCPKVSDRNGILKQFNQTLTDGEIDILALGMRVFGWLSPIYYDRDNLRQKLGDKDFKLLYGNLLKDLQQSYKLAIEEYNDAVSDYSYIGVFDEP